MSDRQEGKRPTGRFQRPGMNLGFTLVELLVVIFIISLLAALLLPALERARDCAVTITCITNLKQCGIACENYAAEHSNRLLTHWNAAGWSSWYGWGYALCAEKILDVRPLVYVCPKIQPKLTNLDIDNYGIAKTRSYGINQARIYQGLNYAVPGADIVNADNSVSHFVIPGQIRQPSTFMLLMDTKLLGSPCQRCIIYPSQTSGISIWTIHQKGLAATVAYGDLHVDVSGTGKFLEYFGSSSSFTSEQ